MFQQRRLRSIASRIASVLMLTVACGAHADAPVVAVAANLSAVAETIAGSFYSDTGISVRLSFGASGILTRQIVRGAPYELFLSADADFPAMLEARGLAAAPPVRFASGRLVLRFPATRSSDDVGEPLSEEDARKLLTDMHVSRVAIANPVHAPYGRAAREMLGYLGVWDTLEPRLVFGESVSQTMRFASAGSVDGAVLPRSARFHPGFALGRFYEIPEDWHQPLPHYMVLLSGAGADARAFFDYMLGSEAREALAAYGYDVPASGN